MRKCEAMMVICTRCSYRAERRNFDHDCMKNLQRQVNELTKENNLLKASKLAQGRELKLAKKLAKQAQNQYKLLAVKNEKEQENLRNMKGKALEL